MAAEPIEQVRQRFRHARARTAEEEARLGEEDFFELPVRLQNQLAVLQAQCEEPIEDEPAAFAAAEHNLRGYHAKLVQALGLVNQLAGARRRRHADRRQRLGKALLGLAVLALLGGGGYLGYGELTARKAALCQRAPECLREGQCAGGVRFEPPLVELTCIAGSDEHCRASERCRRQGQCSAVGGRCLARHDDDCRATPACQLDGLCTARDHRCIAQRREDCVSTAGCIERGECTPDRGVCSVRDDADCQHSLACKQQGACTEVQGQCVKLEGDGGI